MTIRRSSRPQLLIWGWMLSLGLMAVLVVLASLPPWVDAHWRIVLMMAFDPLCHQLPDRSPFLNGIQLAVCDRCYGIYLGLALGPVVSLVAQRWSGRHGRTVVLLTALPMAVDWLIEFVGLAENTPVSRMVTGGLFGVVAGVLVARALGWKTMGDARESVESTDSPDRATD